MDFETEMLAFQAEMATLPVEEDEEEQQSMPANIPASSYGDGDDRPAMVGFMSAKPVLVQEDVKKPQKKKRKGNEPAFPTVPLPPDMESRVKIISAAPVAPAVVEEEEEDEPAAPVLEQQYLEEDALALQPPAPVVANNFVNPNGEKKVFLRKAAGKIWADHTLADWPGEDHRIFCGDLGNEVNDNTLAKVFVKYASFAKAKVVRDKRTQKTRGYGFVSFLDPFDAAEALREMQGAYVGNRPIKLRKSSWNKREYVVKKKGKKSNHLF